MEKRQLDSKVEIAPAEFLSLVANVKQARPGEIDAFHRCVAEQHEMTKIEEQVFKPGFSHPTQTSPVLPVFPEFPPSLDRDRAAAIFTAATLYSLAFTHGPVSTDAFLEQERQWFQHPFVNLKRTLTAMSSKYPLDWKSDISHLDIIPNLLLPPFRAKWMEVPHPWGDYGVTDEAELIRPTDFFRTSMSVVPRPLTPKLSRPLVDFLSSVTHVLWANTLDTALNGCVSSLDYVTHLSFDRRIIQWTRVVGNGLYIHTSSLTGEWHSFEEYDLTCFPSEFFFETLPELKAQDVFKK